MKIKKFIIIFFILFILLPSVQSINIQKIKFNSSEKINVLYEKNVDLPKKINFNPFHIYYADNPETWLLIYNTNNLESIEWAFWYQKERNIPFENMLGLSLPLNEHLSDLTTAKNLIFDPIRDYLASSPNLKRKLIGFIIGYKVPGHYGNPPLFPSIGGYSIASDLQFLFIDNSGSCGELNQDFPPFNYLLIPENRLSRLTMTPGQYMAARIDAPTLEEAKNITIRAKSIEKKQIYQNGFIMII